VARIETPEETRKDHSLETPGGVGAVESPTRRDMTETTTRVPTGEDRMNEVEAAVKTTTGVAVAEAGLETKAGPEMDKIVITMAMTTIAKSATAVHPAGVLEEATEAAGEEKAGAEEPIETSVAEVAIATTSRGMLSSSPMRMPTTPDWSPACIRKMTTETLVRTPEREEAPLVAGVVEDVEAVAVVREPAAEVAVAVAEASQEVAIIIRETEP